MREPHTPAKRAKTVPQRGTQMQAGSAFEIFKDRRIRSAKRNSELILDKLPRLSTISHIETERNKLCMQEATAHRPATPSQ